MKHLPVGNPRQFFATSPVACPYLAGGVERKLVVRLEDPESASLFADLSRAGFRRSHAFAYRPACRGCRMCVPVRIAVERRSEEHTSELQSLMRISYAVFCLKKKNASCIYQLVITQ